MVFWSSFINKIKTSVSKIDFLKLQNRVDKNETAITNNKTSIDNNRINIDTNRQSIETNATDIDQNKKDIALKADKTELNNYYNKTETDAKLDLKANKADTYTKTEVDAKIPDVRNYYTKQEVDASQQTQNTNITNLQNSKADKTQLNNYYTKNESDNTFLNKNNNGITYSINGTATMYEWKEIGKNFWIYSFRTPILRDVRLNKFKLISIDFQGIDTYFPISSGDDRFDIISRESWAVGRVFNIIVFYVRDRTQ